MLTCQGNVASAKLYRFDAMYFSGVRGLPTDAIIEVLVGNGLRVIICTSI